uniref:Uncharacterized protein AlNc14C206G8820 n=1 Tax=Albugo laibachii Nc14 TaxID=890382 RepID=F0WR12_9STRA|nr:conserved hypothetical protein [Albugo laibachii Nc14]|eukprot:CCA23772.1 conserved hypothetical protein [Albugo laibachii Nc14]
MNPFQSNWWPTIDISSRVPSHPPSMSDPNIEWLSSPPHEVLSCPQYATPRIEFECASDSGEPDATFSSYEHEQRDSCELAECLSECMELLKPRASSMSEGRSSETDAIPKEPLDLFDDVDLTNWSLDLFQEHTIDSNGVHQQYRMEAFGLGTVKKYRRLSYQMEANAKQNRTPIFTSKFPTPMSVMHAQFRKPNLPPASVHQPEESLIASKALQPSSLPRVCKVQIATKLNKIYWKNGRKNLQCFPACPEHTDFYSMRINNRKHSSVGVCRGPVYCHLFAQTDRKHTKPVLQRASSLSSSMCTPSILPLKRMYSQGDEPFSTLSHFQSKRDSYVGVNTGGTHQELIVLGRFERVPQQQSLAHPGQKKMEFLPLPSPKTRLRSTEFEEFRANCFQAVEMEDHRQQKPTGSDGNTMVTQSTWFFLPDVWKVEPVLKKKRKATRSSPAQTFPFCFRIYIYARNPPPCRRRETNDSALGNPQSSVFYECIGSTHSEFFELFSTRTVDRVKQKVWSGLPSITPTLNGALTPSD